MRTRKYRVWDAEKQQMRPVSSLHFGSDGSGRKITTWLSEEQRLLLIGGNTELMEYTGLLDRNGKEIFEGDIVAGGTTPEHVKGIVRIGKTDVTLTFGDSSTRIPYMGVYLDGLFDMEEELIEGRLLVVGNLYENPDLLTAHEAQG